MMARLMSVAFTEQAVVERRKTVTRRKGWWVDKHGRRLLHEGDRLTLCRKVMGRKPGEPLVRLAEVEVLKASRLELGLVRVPGELTAEGFPELERWPGPYQGAVEFIERYFAPQGLGWNDEVTRIEWRYLDGQD
jgi:hypothetical protein